MLCSKAEPTPLVSACVRASALQVGTARAWVSAQLGAQRSSSEYSVRVVQQIRSVTLAATAVLTVSNSLRPPPHAGSLSGHRPLSPALPASRFDVA